jgi:hypothetical protein
MEKKEEEKKPVTTEELKKQESEFEKIPKIGAPTTSGIFPGLSGVNEHISILSFLHYKDLIKILKTCRQGYSFIMDEAVRRRILGWKPEKEEETRINNYILSLIQAIDIKE